MGVVIKTGARQFSFSLDSWDDDNTHRSITCTERGALKEVVTVSGALLNILLLFCLASGELEKGLEGGIP